jgi:hypothetical protein
MRSPGAVYTLVRISNTGAIRPFTEMQSGNVRHRIKLAKQYPERGQYDDQHWPESSGQERQARGVDGKSLTELLGISKLSHATNKDAAEPSTNSKSRNKYSPFCYHEDSWGLVKPMREGRGKEGCRKRLEEKSEPSMS